MLNDAMSIKGLVMIDAGSGFLHAGGHRSPVETSEGAPHRSRSLQLTSTPRKTSAKSSAAAVKLPSVVAAPLINTAFSPSI
jgi:hypothetical protein